MTKAMPSIAEFPTHSQSVERVVKMVTEASNIVYRYENRHKTLLTKITFRKLQSNFSSKGLYDKNYVIYILTSHSFESL